MGNWSRIGLAAALAAGLAAASADARTLRWATVN
jgi:hypothetical protein